MANPRARVERAWRPARCGRGAARRAAVLAAALALPVPPAGGAGPAASAAPATETRNADDLLIVDCLLPARVRRLGRDRTYLQPRKPVRTTAVDCRIRGGEYTEPDQATYATALEVWLPQAKAGDAEAQFYVGQIFEKGLGATADYEAAAEWYRKAAEQEYGPAQISLGHFHELGLGVAADEVEALNWYRRAAGLAEDLVVLQEADYAALVAARAELDASRGQVEGLEREIEELRRQLRELENRSEKEAERQATLESLVARLENDLVEQKRGVALRVESISDLERRLAERAAAEPGTAAAPPPVAAGIDFGSYHALVIGNQNYQTLPDLATAAADARAVAELLESKYGFEVELLIDADRYQTMTALNRLREGLTEKDNLLVYYAGHGRRDERGATAYWQPVDADAANPANWIPSEVVTEHLDLVPARHVLVVADSAYSGLRSRSSIARLPAGMSAEQRFHHLRLMRERRARLVLASGADAPAAGAGGRSRFSSALVEVLEENEGVLEASRVYRQLVDRVAAAPGTTPPEFATMRWARNDVADFFFVPEP